MVAVAVAAAGVMVVVVRAVVGGWLVGFFGSGCCGKARNMRTKKAVVRGVRGCGCGKARKNMWTKRQDTTDARQTGVFSTVPTHFSTSTSLVRDGSVAVSCSVGSNGGMLQLGGHPLSLIERVSI